MKYEVFGIMERKEAGEWKVCDANDDIFGYKVDIVNVYFSSDTYDLIDYILYNCEFAVDGGYTVHKFIMYWGEGQIKKYSDIRPKIEPRFTVKDPSFITELMMDAEYNFGQYILAQDFKDFYNKNPTVTDCNGQTLPLESTVYDFYIKNLMLKLGDSDTRIILRWR